VNAWGYDDDEEDSIPCTPAQEAEIFAYILLGCSFWVALVIWLVGR
jgi:hypothetical protein